MRDAILILGASGLVGHQVFFAAQKKYGDRVYGTYRKPRPALRETPHLKPLDLLHTEEVIKILSELRPKYVINCAGIIRSLCVDPYEALTINSALPHLLRRLLDQWGGRLLHVSTDGVFSGKKGSYQETDPPDPAHLYGKSKLLGEVTENPHLTVRTSVIGDELDTRRGLFTWFLDQRGKVLGFRKVKWSGLTSEVFASIALDLLTREEICGVLNVSGDPIDKYSLLELIAEVFEKDDITLEPTDTPIEDRTLDPSRLKALGFKIPTHREMLLRLKLGSGDPETVSSVP